MGFLICSFVPLLRLAMNITREQETALLQGPIAARLQLTMKCSLYLYTSFLFSLYVIVNFIIDMYEYR